MPDELQTKFETRFPEITINSGDWDTAMSLYPNFLGTKWGVSEEGDNKVLYLLAHLITVIGSHRAEGAGIVGDRGRLQSKTVGKISVSYAITPLSAEEEFRYGSFLSTKYGKMYLSLIHGSMRVGAAFV
jgi:hypothetical protein